MRSIGVHKKLRIVVPASSSGHRANAVSALLLDLRDIWFRRRALVSVYGTTTFRRSLKPEHLLESDLLFIDDAWLYSRASVSSQGAKRCYEPRGCSGL